ncbi:MAG TPA: hypothetical protein VFU02_15985 [Polyangiaceae bacterium]|nr:hypothetical protein [Polyangiaceae bacterium]
MTAISPKLRLLPTLLTAVVWTLPTTARAGDPSSADEARNTGQTREVPTQENAVVDEISGSFVAGPGWFEPGDVEDRLRAHGFEEMDAQAVLLGLSARIIFDSKIALGAGGAVLGHEQVEGSGAYTATLGYGVLRAECGYAFLHSETWLLLPKLALGAYSANLNLADSSDATFDELLEEPGTTTNISSRGFLMGALLDFEVRITPDQSAGRQGFFGVGLEGGYLYSIPLSRWRSDTGAEADDGPDAPLTGGFVGITLGGGVHGI